MNTNLTRANKIRLFVVAIIFLGFASYIIRNLYNIQILNFEKYQTKAIEQQTRSTVIKPKRGTIFDRNMKVLAVNAPAERIFINPSQIKTDEDARLISQGLSEILGVDYDFVYEKTDKKHRQDETIKNKVEKELADKVREFKDENNLPQICLVQDTKRKYPFNNLASHVIGFTSTTENYGRLGIEMQYEDELKGVEGKIITAKNAVGKSMELLEYEDYIDAKNGNSLVLTLDWGIQYILENQLEAALEESQATNRVTGIVMNVNNGEILAMATKPDFNLNDPTNISDIPEIYLEGLKDDILKRKPDITEEQLKSEMTFGVWKNKSITETYEPGSTFKVITAAMALEEDAVTMNDGFVCPGFHIVAGQRIGCHLRGGHGSLSFARGIQQSCNPVFMKAAEKLGGTNFLKYFDAFGYNEKTGIDLPGEASGITHSAANFRTVELATSSFGQTFRITPIQHITALAAVANGGKLVTPHLVKQIIDENNNIIKSFDTTVKRNVISEEVCKQIAAAMAEGVSTDGAARNAFVKGYEVAAKTGTSQKRDEDEEDRIGSCIAFAPADDPEIIVMIMVDEPSVGSVYGGVIAAPYISRVLAEVLPYLGFDPQYTEDEIMELSVPVDDYRNLKVDEAKKAIEKLGLKVSVEGNGLLVKEQIPKVGNTLAKGGTVILYTNASDEQNLVTVPDVLNLTAEKANKKIINAGLNISIIGAEDMKSSAIAIKQKPEAGAKCPPGTIVEVEFRHYDGVH